MTGCGKHIHITGTNGGTMPCGARLTHIDKSVTVELCDDCNPEAPAKRTERLYKYFGWQGGTIHQLAQETGVDAYTLLYSEHTTDYDKFSQGALAASAVKLAGRLELAKHVKGNVSFWLGVARTAR